MRTVQIASVQIAAALLALLGSTVLFLSFQTDLNSMELKPKLASRSHQRARHPRPNGRRNRAPDHSRHGSSTRKWRTPVQCLSFSRNFESAWRESGKSQRHYLLAA